jgi:hypothetical protein
MAIPPTDIRILFTNYDIITYVLNQASCSEHFISIKHWILATFNINKKQINSESLYAFKPIKMWSNLIDKCYITRVSFTTVILYTGTIPVFNKHLRSALTIYSSCVWGLNTGIKARFNEPSPYVLNTHKLYFKTLHLYYVYPAHKSH